MFSSSLTDLSDFSGAASWVSLVVSSDQWCGTENCSPSSPSSMSKVTRILLLRDMAVVEERMSGSCLVLTRKIIQAQKVSM